jgi:eukaryotic-like serine/threonine-protein kinase
VGSPDAAALLSLAESIADGAPIDWVTAEERATAGDQAVIRQLRILSDVAGLHRSLLPDAVRAPQSARQAPAQAIGTWAHLALIERLGGGTFGEVYRAWDRHLEREVALKLLLMDETVDDLHASRIAMEGRLIARVRHPNVITVYGVASHNDRVGLWMELVRGVTLEQLIAEHGLLSAREAAMVGIDLCRALAAIHAAGLIHRDVKAQNVMREDGGRIVLMDLGTGREAGALGRTATPDLAGTPLYLAPEIFSGAAASERTDLYSLGVLLYHLVTGAFPVRATTMEELHEGHKKARAVGLRDARADLPTAFVRVVDRAIASDPERRYATAGALEADLGQVLDHAAPAAAPARVPERWARIWVSKAGMLAAALALIAIASIGWLALRGRRAPIPAPAVIRSIAVLPLVNLSGDPAQEYFADGMTDELIATLGRIGQLNVISRTSVMAFKGSGQSLPQIARTLNVDAVLEGSVFVIRGGSGNPPSRDKVRINARLIHAGTDLQLWNRTFEEEITNVLTLQSHVAGAVAEEINVQLTPQQARDLAGPGTRDPDAQDAYLQGRYMLNNVSRSNLITARARLQRAIQLDPADARAYASLAWCYSSLENYGVLGHFEAASLASAAATAAVRLNDKLAEAHSRLADVIFQYQWDWAGAERAYRRAIELNPSDSYTNTQYARFLMAQGRLTQALQQAKRAEEADPLSPEAKEAVALVLYYDRKYDAAVAQFQRARALAPRSAQPHFGLGRAYAGKGAGALAIDELKQAATLSERSPGIVAELARTYAAFDQKDDARRLVLELNDRSRQPDYHVSPHALANVYAALGDRDRAFESLNAAFAERVASVLWLKVDPRADSLRQDPRFEPLVRRLGIPQ